MTDRIGAATWYVAEGDGSAYTHAGAPQVREVKGLVAAARNEALQEAWEQGLICIQVDDDLRGVKVKRGDRWTEATCEEAFSEMLLNLSASVFQLVGVPPTANTFFANGAIASHAFIIGSAIAVKPCGLLFDETLPLKEDYDYTLQHWAEYGGAARLNYIVFDFAHYTNPGGAVSYRDARTEQQAIGRLKHKWGSLVRDNPKRRNEVLLVKPRGSR